MSNIINPYGTKVHFAIRIIKARHGEATVQIQLLEPVTFKPIAQYEPMHLNENMVARFNEPVNIHLPPIIPKVAP